VEFAAWIRTDPRIKLRLMTEKELYIIIQDGTVFIKDNNDDRILYRIRQQELPLKMNDDTSEWIMQLMDKTWIDVGTLYRLAQTIKQEFPDNDIDWRKTFFIVEKSNYLDTLGDILTEKHKSVTKNVYEMIDFGRKETNKETHQIIEEILDKRLTEFNL
jgi:hypothetical protein